jgi:AcrR family transcriptional regulator
MTTMKRDTKTQILVASLSLFNEQGEPNTTTNDIANEADISPGNLHYHFKKKANLVEALLAEFQADVRRALDPPTGDEITIDDFWAFLHLLLEVLTAYVFLFRDIETLVSTYPKVGHALKGFSKGLTAIMQLYIEALRRNDVLDVDDREVPVMSRNLVVIVLFSERFDEISGLASPVDVSALRIARSVLGILLPHSSEEAAALIEELTERYSEHK